MFLSGTEDNDPMSSHFSAVTDATGNVFVTFTDAAACTSPAGMPRPPVAQQAQDADLVRQQSQRLAHLFPDRLAGRRSLLLASNIRDNIRVWKGSTSASPGFTRLLQTTHTVRDANAYYTDARLEMPALPVLAAIPLPQVAGVQPRLSAAREGRLSALAVRQRADLLPSNAPNCD
jgi:hypothetical protein